MCICLKEGLWLQGTSLVICSSSIMRGKCFLLIREFDHSSASLSLWDSGQTGLEPYQPYTALNYTLRSGDSQNFALPLVSVSLLYCFPVKQDWSKAIAGCNSQMKTCSSSINNEYHHCSVLIISHKEYNHQHGRSHPVSLHSGMMRVLRQVNGDCLKSGLPPRVCWRSHWFA